MGLGESITAPLPQAAGRFRARFVRRRFVQHRLTWIAAGAALAVALRIPFDDRPLTGDVAVWFGELDEPQSEGQLRVRALDPELVWLTHEDEPWRPPAV